MSLSFTPNSQNIFLSTTFYFDQLAKYLFYFYVSLYVNVSYFILLVAYFKMLMKLSSSNCSSTNVA